jgi:hypothetical protein
VKEAIRGAAAGEPAESPRVATPARPGQAAPTPESLVIQRGFEGLDTQAAPAAPAATARARPATAVASEPAPIVIERSLVLPVSAADLAKGSRKIRLVLDLDLRPEA